MFEKTRLKLTGWYLLIIMAISIAFSVFIYIGATREFDRVLRIQRFRIEHPEQFRAGLYLVQQLPEPPESQVIEDANIRVVIALLGVNGIILILSALSGYFLAGRTLKPIKEMVEEQNRFITDASHELRTPLTSLRTEIEVGLRNKELSSTEANSLLQSNLEEVISLQKLSDNLLELAQDGNNLGMQSMAKASIKTIVADAIKKVEPQARKKQIVIENKVKEAKIFCAYDRVKEVFVILLDNAIKYSSDKNKVTIFSKNENESVILTVKDRGIGIAKDDVPHIFDRFYRSDKSRSKQNTAGYGLGLSIAKQILTSHNGSISVESVETKGTTFTVRIPYVKDE